MAERINGKGMAIYVPNGNTRLDMERIAYVVFPYISVTASGEGDKFPYSVGQDVRVKVYDPQEREDCDRDTRAWRFNFSGASLKLIDSSIWITGISTDHGVFTSFGFAECEEGHLPYEHDGVCQYNAEWSYEGLLELQLFDAYSEEDKFEINKDFFKRAGSNYK